MQDKAFKWHSLVHQNEAWTLEMDMTWSHGDQVTGVSSEQFKIVDTESQKSFLYFILSSFPFL